MNSLDCQLSGDMLTTSDRTSRLFGVFSDPPHLYVFWKCFYSQRNISQDIIFNTQVAIKLKLYSWLGNVQLQGTNRQSMRMSAAVHSLTMYEKDNVARNSMQARLKPRALHASSIKFSLLFFIAILGHIDSPH